MLQKYFYKFVCYFRIIFPTNLKITFSFSIFDFIQLRFLFDHFFCLIIFYQKSNFNFFLCIIVFLYKKFIICIIVFLYKKFITNTIESIFCDIPNKIKFFNGRKIKKRYYKSLKFLNARDSSS